MENIIDKIKGTIYGQAIEDALGLGLSVNPYYDAGYDQGQEDGYHDGIYLSTLKKKGIIKLTVGKRWVLDDV